MRAAVIIAVMSASFCFSLWGIPWLLKRFPRPVWRYPANVSVDRLHGHHRFAALCVYACFVCIVGAVSSLLQVVVLGWQRWTQWMLVVYGAGVMVSALPAIVLGAWMGEVERECRRRGAPLPAVGPLRERVRSDALRVLFWILAAIAAPWVFRLVSGR